MKIPHASWPKKGKQETEYCNKFNKDLRTFHLKKKILKKENCENQDFSGSPVVKESRFHCRGHGFNSWSGTKAFLPHGEAKISRNISKYSFRGRKKGKIKGEGLKKENMKISGCLGGNKGKETDKLPGAKQQEIPPRRLKYGSGLEAVAS